MNLKKYFDENTWIGHLILSSDTENLEKIADRENFDIENCKLVLTIDDVVIRDETIEKFLKYIIERYNADLIEKIENFDKMVADKANELLKEKIDGVIDKLHDINEHCEDILSSI